MVAPANSVEIILGAKRDLTFGSVIMVGMGGITAELYRDRALGLPPLNERLARRMLESLASYPLLVGYRGRPKVDVDRLIEILIRFSYLIADYPEIKELDMNPLLVSPDGMVGLDARVVVDDAGAVKERRSLLSPGHPAVSRGIRARHHAERWHEGAHAPD